MKTLRIVTVIVLCAVAFAWAGPDLLRPLGRPLGDFGYRTDGHRITSVDPGSPAAKAGLHAGDIVDFGLTDSSRAPQRIEALQDFSSAPGGRLNLRIIAPHARRIVLTSVPEPASQFPYLILRNGIYLITVLIGALLFLLRPSGATCALFVFSIGAIGRATAVTDELLHFSPLDVYIRDAFRLASQIAIVAFALSLPCKPFERTDRMLLVLGAALAAPVLAVQYLPGISERLSFYVGAIPFHFLFAIVAFVRAYRRSEEQQRAGMQWMVGSAVIVAICFVLAGWLNRAYLPYPVLAVLSVSPVLIFASAAYTLLANRIVDFSFVASRALVYAILTSITLGILALIDWFVAKQLDAVRLGFFFEVGAALALGVAIQRMHRWSDNLVDTYVFRSAHEAEVRLKRLGAALAHAPSSETVDRIVCDDAAQSLALASAAIFHATGDDGFVRTASCDWPEAALRTIPAGHRLALYLASEERPTVPDDAFGVHDALPEGTATPALALPLIVRHRLIGFILYGSHTNGAQPDAKDVELLAEFASRATAAYDHLAMEDRTHENRELRSNLDSLRAQNDLLKSMLVETGAAR